MEKWKLPRPTLAAVAGLATLVTAALACATSTTGDHPSLPGDAGSDGSSSGATHEAGGSSGGSSGGGSGSSTGGSGGSSGGGSSSGGAGEAGSGDGGVACSSLPLCDDFEGDTNGAQPKNWSAVMGCNPQTMDTAAPGGGLIVGIDSSQHHSGSNSLRVVGGDSCGYYAVNTTAFASLGMQVYVRYWAMWSTGVTQNHNGFMAMTTSGGDHLRLGFQDNIIDWNAEKSDSTLPNLDPQGATLSVAPMANTWTCIEFHLDETTGNMDFWYNGAPATTAGLSFNGTSTQGVSDQWSTGRPNPLVTTDLGLGWLDLNNSETVWFDDVAVSDTGRIGCD